MKKLQSLLQNLFSYLLEQLLTLLCDYLETSIAFTPAKACDFTRMKFFIYSSFNRCLNK